MSDNPEMGSLREMIQSGDGLDIEWYRNHLVQAIDIIITFQQDQNALIKERDAALRARDDHFRNSQRLAHRLVESQDALRSLEQQPSANPPISVERFTVTEQELSEQLALLYNHSSDESLQFSRHSMTTAIYHGMSVMAKKLGKSCKLVSDAG